MVSFLRITSSYIYDKYILVYLQSGENKTLKIISICFKNERKLCVYNISLCDEIKSRKISENKLQQTSKLPHKWKYPQSQGNEIPKNDSISYKMRESCVYVENIILCAWKLIYKTKSLCIGTSLWLQQSHKVSNL